MRHLDIANKWAGHILLIYSLTIRIVHDVRIAHSGRMPIIIAAITDKVIVNQTQNKWDSSQKSFEKQLIIITHDRCLEQYMFNTCFLV